MESRHRFRAVLLAVLIFGTGIPAPAGGEDWRIDRALDCLDYMLYDEAVSLLSEVLLEDGPPKPGLHTKLAFAYFRLKEPEKAMRHLRLEIGADPEDLKPLVLLSHIQYASGLKDEAETTARKFQDALALNLKTKTKKRETNAVLRDLAPNAGLPFYILAMRAKERRDAAAARAWLIRARDFGYDPADCWIQAIDAEMEAGNDPEALRLCETRGDISPAGGTKTADPGADPAAAESAIPVPADVFTLKAILLAWRGNAGEARIYLEHALELRPFDHEILKNLAVVELGGEDYEKASRLLEEAARLNPSDFHIRVLLEQAQKKRRTIGTSTASEFSKEFLKARDPRFRYVFGRRVQTIAGRINDHALRFVQSGLLGDAARFLRAFTELDRNSPEIFYNLGLLCNNLGLQADALRYGWEAVGLKKDYRDAYDLLGNAWFKLGDFEYAARFYEESVRLDPDDPLSFFNLGCAYRELGNAARAEANWLEAVKLERAVPAAGGSSESKSEEMKYSLHVKVDPVSAQAVQYLGTLYAEQKKTSQAVEFFRKAIAFHPQDPQPYFEIGRIFREAGETAKAEDYFKKFRSLGGDETKIKGLAKKIDFTPAF